jgi:hypothetical protein
MSYEKTITMARQKGNIHLTGAIGDLSYYHSQHGWLVRQKGGPSKERITTHPNFQRTRENISEFSAAASSGKLFRNSVQQLIHTSADNEITPRLLQLFQRIKQYDVLSDRGKRRVHNGLADPEGLQLLRNFAFNRRVPLSTIVSVPIETDLSAGIIRLANFIPETALNFPDFATHAAFSGAWTCIDFDRGTSHTNYMPSVVIPLNDEAVTVELQAAVPSGMGLSFLFLQVVFLQEIGERSYMLKDGRGMGVV